MTEVDVIDLAIARGDATEALEIDQALEASPLLSAEVKDVEGKPYRLLISTGGCTYSGEDLWQGQRSRRSDLAGSHSQELCAQKEGY